MVYILGTCHSHYCNAIISAICEQAADIKRGKLQINGAFVLFAVNSVRGSKKDTMYVCMYVRTCGARKRIPCMYVCMYVYTELNSHMHATNANDRLGGHV